MDPHRTSTRSGYDRVAEEYARRIFDELKDKPLDRALLTRLAKMAAGLGPVCDLGCGPGQVARFISQQGADALGIDLSPKMVELARRLNPGIEFEIGDICRLPVPDNTWGGAAAFYSLIHIVREEMETALREIYRALKPGGTLLAAFHIGDETTHLEEWWGQPVSIDFHFFQPLEMEGYLCAAGFERIETTIRDPYPDVEHQSRRAYIFAGKPR